jgi:glycosyltransferase involved in cell wall biosynthesis
LLGGGIPELIRSGLDGVIVADETPQALKAALSDLIRSPEQFSSLGREARSSLDGEFSFDRHLAGWRDVLSKVRRNEQHSVKVASSG